MTHPALHHTDHRPWPLPEARWSWRQSWCDLAFLHWPIPAALLRPLIPAALDIQEFEGSAWIGVVPFHMRGVMRRRLPDLPWISAFPELNVRTYVSAEGKPGVWFFSLDATQPVAVWAARTFFHLPYFVARIDCEVSSSEVRYRSVRTDSRSESAARFAARYRSTSAVYESTPGTLEAELTERYCLYAPGPRETLLRTEVHHRRWPLERAEVEIESNTMLAAVGLPTPTEAPLAHFARRIDVVVWSPERVGGAVRP